MGIDRYRARHTWGYMDTDLLHAEFRFDKHSTMALKCLGYHVASQQKTGQTMKR